MTEREGYVYLLMNKGNSVIYTGVTSNLQKRIYEHKSKLVEGFTKKYRVTKTVYYEACGNIEIAILREKQIKAGSRKKEVEMVKGMSPEVKDLYDRL